jgi:hypothetical protein
MLLNRILCAWHIDIDISFKRLNMATKIMREPWLWRRFTSNAIEQYLGSPGEPIIDIRTGVPSLHICDGVTPGGVAMSMDASFEGIARPTIVSPTDGATGVTSSPIITGSGFLGVLPGGTVDTHAASYLEIAYDAGFTNFAYQSGRDDQSLTEFDLSQKGVVLNDGTVYARIMYEGSTGTLSQWSTVVSFTVTGMSIGSTLPDGGIIFGQDGGDWLVVAPARLRTIRSWGLYGTDTSLPNASGTNGSPTTPTDPNSSEYNTSVLVSPNYNSINDGYGNIGCPAAEYCRSIGYDLPNASDLQLIYNNRTQIDALDTTGGATLSAIGSGTAPGSAAAYVWSSSEYNSAYAWSLYFSYGYWGYNGKGSSRWVVPFRRIPV